MLRARCRAAGSTICRTTRPKWSIFLVLAWRLRRRIATEIRSDDCRRPMLGAGLKVDTATMLFGGTEISVAALTLGAGVENSGAAASPTAVLPFGGGIKIGRFNVESVTDSAGARFRDIAGHVKLQRFNGADRLPELLAELSLGSVAAGSKDFAFCFVRRLA